MVLVFLLIAAALVLFATEVVPVDITALGVLVTLLLVQPVTERLVTLGVLADPIYVLAPPGSDRTALEEGLSGFANAATITPVDDEGSDTDATE
jgi:di/tricarboxylate transporter